MILRRNHMKSFKFVLYYIFLLCLFLSSLLIFSCPNKDKQKKVLLVSIDGLRSDALLNTEYGDWLKTRSTFSFNMQTVFPPITQPCHFSMFYSVEPDIHGVFENLKEKPSIEIEGITQRLLNNNKSCAVFYDYKYLDFLFDKSEKLFNFCIDGEEFGYENTYALVMQNCLDYISNNDVDFTFLYFGFPDEMGHVYGFLSKEYYSAIKQTFSSFLTLYDTLSNEYTIIITSDHGGHEKTHGEFISEDMTIPFFIIGDDYSTNQEIENVSILDVAPTVTTILNISPNESWTGKAIVQVEE